MLVYYSSMTDFETEDSRFVHPELVLEWMREHGLLEQMDALNDLRGRVEYELNHDVPADVLAWHARPEGICLPGEDEIHSPEALRATAMFNELAFSPPKIFGLFAQSDLARHTRAVLSAGSPQPELNLNPANRLAEASLLQIIKLSLANAEAEGQRVSVNHPVMVEAAHQIDNPNVTPPGFDNLVRSIRNMASNAPATKPIIDLRDIYKIADSLSKVQEGAGTYIRGSDTFVETVSQAPSIATARYCMLASFVDVFRSVKTGALQNHYGDPAERFTRVHRTISAYDTAYINQAAEVFDQFIKFAHDDSDPDPVLTVQAFACTIAGVSEEDTRAWLEDGAVINEKAYILANAAAGGVVAYAMLNGIDKLDNTFEIRHEHQIPDDIPQRFAQLEREFYDYLPTISFENKTELESALAILMGTEGGRKDIIQRTIEELVAQRVFSRADFEPYDLLTPHLANFLNEHNLNQQLTELAPFLENCRAEIARVNEAYQYSSRKIRGFNGGTALLGELGRELDDREMLNDENLRHVLAIMMLQAENASDRATYFDQLRENRDTAERRLYDMQFLGVYEQSALTDICLWMDEVIDAGSFDRIQLPRLKNFILEYLIGPDPAISEPTEAVEISNAIDEPYGPVTEDSSEIELQIETEEVVIEPQAVPVDTASEPREPAEVEEITEVQTETEAEREAANTRTRHIIDTYFSTLRDVLETIEIEFSDVHAFPPGRRERNRGDGTNVTAESRPPMLDPSRLRNLIELKRAFEIQGKSARLIVTRPTAWSYLPYFALYIQDDRDVNRGVCVMENPVIRHANFVITVDGDNISNWEDIASVSRTEAQQRNGVQMFVHPTQGSRGFSQHYDVKLRSHMLTELYRIRRFAT